MDNPLIGLPRDFPAFQRSILARAAVSFRSVMMAFLERHSVEPFGVVYPVVSLSSPVRRLVRNTPPSEKPPPFALGTLRLFVGRSEPGRAPIEVIESPTARRTRSRTRGGKLSDAICLRSCRHGYSGRRLPTPGSSKGVGALAGRQNTTRARRSDLQGPDEDFAVESPSSSSKLGLRPNLMR